jgi:hypothetical protein
MANDTEWVQDIRRWYFGGHPPSGETVVDGQEGQEELAVGYEAALPCARATTWPDALVAGDL